MIFRMRKKTYMRLINVAECQHLLDLHNVDALTTTEYHKWVLKCPKAVSNKTNSCSSTVSCTVTVLQKYNKAKYCPPDRSKAIK